MKLNEALETGAKVTVRLQRADVPELPYGELTFSRRSELTNLLNPLCGEVEPVGVDKHGVMRYSKLLIVFDSDTLDNFMPKGEAKKA